MCALTLAGSPAVTVPVWGSSSLIAPSPLSLDTRRPPFSGPGPCLISAQGYKFFFSTLASHLLMKAQLPFSVSETTLTVLESEVMAGEGGTTFWVPTVLAGRSGAP